MMVDILRHYIIKAIIIVSMFCAGSIVAKTFGTSLNGSDSSQGDTSNTNNSSDTIDYSARYIKYNVNKKILNLYGKASISYGNMVLVADTITYNTQTNILKAVGYPTLKDDGDDIVAESMSYNLKTKWGKAVFGTTNMGKGLYNGRKIRKTDKKVLLVTDGDYSTCSLKDSSHYYFYGKQMKIIAKDKVVSKPVVMDIAEVPVLTLPYFIFPVKTGRRSGVLMPRYGGSEYGNYGAGSRYIDNFGYYFAPNDYCDFTIKSRITEFKDVKLIGSIKYKLRYWLDGSINGSSYFMNDDLGLSQRWDVNYRHNQNFTPDGSFTLRGSGSIMGDKEYQRKTGESLEKLINRKTNAHLTLSKIWREKDISFSVTGRQNRDLITDRKEEYLPIMNLNIGQRLLIKVPEKLLSTPDTVSEEEKWYHKIYYGINSVAQNKRIIDTIPSINKGAVHNFRLSSPQTLFGHLTFSPNFSYTESWFESKIDTTMEKTVKVSETDTIVRDTVIYDTTWGFFRRGTYNVGVSANTKLYGVFPIPIRRFVGIRHTLTPSVSYNFSPKQSGGWKYRHIGIGNTSDRNKQQTINYSVSNLFQGKLKKSKNKRVKKFNILSLGISSGYNFATEEKRKMSNLNVNASTYILGKLNLNYNSAYSFYRTLDKIVYPWLTSQSISASTGLRLSGRWWTGDINLGLDDFKERLGSSSMETWNLNISHSYTYNFNRYEDGREGTRKNYGLNGNARVKLTRTWDINYRAKYDFTTNSLVNQSINFYKDLHCWQMVFNWVPTGPAKGYFFKIDIKQIPDIKIEKREQKYGRGY